MNEARQREVWLTDFSPTLGHEQDGKRPAVVISADQFGTGASGMCLVVPCTTSDKHPNPLHVKIQPPEGGQSKTTYAMVDMTRSISRERLISRWGAVRPSTLRDIRLRLLALTYTP